MQMEGDITEFIFAEEVPQALSRLEQFVSSPPAKSPVTELNAQLQVLATLGDILNLEGFAAIAQAATDALIANSSQYVPIASFALKDFRLGQEAVLNGDRTQGGEPSNALLELVQPQSDGSPIAFEILDDEPPADTTTLLETNNSDSDLIDELGAIQILEEDDSLEDGELLFSADDLASLIIEDDDDDAGDLLSSVLEEEIISEPPVPVTKPTSPEPTANEITPTPVQQIQPKQSPIPTETAHADTKSPTTPAAKSAPQDLSVGRSPSKGSVIDTSSLSVRMEMGRLNLLNNLVGELVTQDNSALLRNQQSSDALDALKRSFNRSNKIIAQFQQYAKELVIRNPQARGQLAQFVVFASMMVEEMAQVSETIEDTTLINQQEQQNLKQRQQSIKQLEQNLLEARMLPIGDLLNRFPRTVRDLSVKANKPVTLELEGTKTLVDRSILSKLYDPMVHLVRNAFDHGIDIPEERLEANKSESGTIMIRAYNRGNSTYVEVQDDGRGIDIEKIRAKAIEKDIVDETEAQNMTSAQLYELLFVPGFSTAAQVSHLSGRGVGLDAVRLQIRALKGNISIASEKGKGTTFTLRLPWSMTITKLLIFRAQESFFAIPVNSLSAIAAASPKDISKKDNKEVFNWNGQSVPVLQDALVNFNYPSSLINSHQQMMGTWARSNRGTVWQQAGQQMILVLTQGADVMGIKVDQILLEQNLVIKPFGTAISPPSYISGCTVLGDGRLVSVLDGAALLEQMLNKTTKTIAIADNQYSNIEPRVVLPTVLVIDDSLTTRQTLSTTLQKAGYRVVQAQDSADGLNQLEQHPEVEGIICDVEMPQMNGFEFLGRCRKKHAKTDLPVLMLTSRGSKRYRQLANQLGASGYLTKPYLDQELITTLKEAVAETKKQSV